jgi:hypothetical protein
MVDFTNSVSLPMNKKVSVTFKSDGDTTSVKASIDPAGPVLASASFVSGEDGSTAVAVYGRLRNKRNLRHSFR